MSDTTGKLLRCDLVMQGGITSGLVYPGAVIELSKHYQFEDVGGASAGAIAAVVTAAAEYRRRVLLKSAQRIIREGKPVADPREGFLELERVVGELKQPGFLRNLFQPSEQLRRVYEALLPLAVKPTWSARIGGVLAALARSWMVALPVIGIAAIALGAILFIEGDGRMSALATIVMIVFAIGVVLLAFGVAFLVHALLLGMQLLTNLKSNGFGFCPGIRQPGFQQMAVADWIYEKVQQCAGLDLGRPLTFADLRDEGIYLRLVTTDLSHGRPVTLPLHRQEGYLFKDADLKRVLPQAVMTLLMKGAEVRVGDETYRRLPGENMPVAMAARLSLSFPVLMSAVRLYARHPHKPQSVVEHWLSDGGITSNFPIHFFDEWLPRTPTFGLTLQSAEAEPNLPSSMVRLSASKPSPRWSGTDDVFQFFMQMFDASRNWRDAMQAELTGSRDRVCEVFLRETEGGLNLDMDVGVIDDLVQRGHAAGLEIHRRFNWDRHQSLRYQTLMQLMQMNLRATRESYLTVTDPFRPKLEARSRSETQIANAASSQLEATDALVAVVDEFGTGDGLFGGPGSVPNIVMRVVPDV